VPGTVEIASEHEIQPFEAVPGTDMLKTAAPQHLDRFG